MTPQQPRRQAVVEGGMPMVVTLEKYVDVQVDSVANRVSAAEKRVDAVEKNTADQVAGLRSELLMFKQEMRTGMTEIHGSITALREDDVRRGQSWSTLTKVGVFLAGTCGVVVPVVTLIITVTHPA